MKKEKRIKQNEKDFSEPHAYVHFEILNKIEKKNKWSNCLPVISSFLPRNGKTPVTFQKRRTVDTF